jgi:hypothetical protein
MPLFAVDKQATQLRVVKPTGFSTGQWLERQDLQPLLRDNPSAIDPSVKIIAQEFGEWEGSARRIDLLGLDPQGNLVIIELKRVEDGGHMELQSLRYAAMVSSMDFEGAVRAYEAFLQKAGRQSDGARDELTALLGPDPVISQTPRIVLVAPSFSREITTAVLWLNNQGLNIRCVRANLYDLAGAQYVDIDQVIPLPAAGDYQVRIREKEKAERQAAQRRQRRAQTIDILVASHLLVADTRVHLVRVPRAGLLITDDRAKHATFLSTEDQRFRWDYDGKDYSLSGLCRRLCEVFSGDVGSGAFQGPLYWALDGDTVSLAERAVPSQTEGVSAEAEADAEAVLNRTRGEHLEFA